ncbi:GerAB/ArcD/ProY family transporter [Halobacillus locisalis]|uniref:GerAB/ArcD/ProY family transporter n=1 Tax=Halobacillus locisalis TaxID=220753 RepID=A0A838CQE3_9BACI|nr:GerAB/ArcD/ProY family transporter [Halobacillus locisalis]
MPEVCSSFSLWIGRFISFFYLAFIYILAALVLRSIGDFMTTQIISETPLQFTHILFLLVVIAGAYLGIEVMGRSAETFMPWLVLLLLFLTISISPQISLDNLKPYFGNGVLPVISASKVVIGTPFHKMVT